MKKKLCVLGLFFKEGNVLGVSRKDNHADFGLPGGKVDEGETLEVAIDREIFEETGLVVKDKQLIWIAEDANDYLCYVYLVREWEGEINTRPVDPKETGVVKWTDFIELESGSFGEFNKKLRLFVKKENIC
jgi:ADP-ribose pyrophosphatase YjhB (NUDIX family)